MSRLRSFPHLVGHHCSSSAVRSVLAFDGVHLSEAAVFGLGSGLGFFYTIEPDGSPSRRFNGRAPDLEGSFFRRLGLPLQWERAWHPQAIRLALERGRPVLAQTDIFPIPYYDDVHFIGHGLVVVGLEGEEVLVADIAAPELSRMPLGALEAALASRYFPLLEPFGYASAPRLEHVDVGALAPGAIGQTARYLLEPPSNAEGIAAMRRLADDLPGWRSLEDGSWAARFGYQGIEKRGTGGGNFRFLYASFLDEVTALGFDLAWAAGRLRQAARIWQQMAEALKGAAFAPAEDSRAEAFERAGRLCREAAALEEAVFGSLAERFPEVD